MITFLIDTDTKTKVEILDQDAQFMEGQIVTSSLTGYKKKVVSEIILMVNVSGNAGSITQNVFVKDYEEKK